MAAMKRVARPTTAADAPAIRELFAAAALHPNIDVQALNWKYWQPRADWPGPRSFILTDDGVPVAHGAIVPTWCASPAQRVSMIHVIDWVARPGAIGAGVALMKHIGQQSQALLAVGGSADTAQILPLIGFRDMGAVTGYVRALFPLRLLRESASQRGRLVGRFVRSLMWTLGASTTGSADWAVRRLEATDLEAIAAALPTPARGIAVLERNPALLRHALECPIASMALYAMEKSGRARGYFLLASAPGQVRIADCWMDSDELDDWRAMVVCAVKQARRDGQAAEVVIWANDRLLEEALSACGFRARLKFPVRLRAADAALLPPLPVRVQMLDNDAAFLHHGRREYWA